jgi:hypothetical protein
VKQFIGAVELALGKVALLGSVSLKS